MDDVVLLENPRRRRARTKSGRFKKTTRRKATTRRRRKTTRRRRSNPVALANPKRRRRRRSTARRASPVRRRRRSRRSKLSSVLGVNRAIGIVKDAGLFAVSEFVGEMAARTLFRKFNFLSTPLINRGLNYNTSRPYIQIVLGIVGGPILDMLHAPKAVRKYWEISNVASGIIGLTAGLRRDALKATGLDGFDDMHGMQDWVENPRLAEPSQPAPPAAIGLSDWAEFTGANSSGDPFSA